MIGKRQQNLKMELQLNEQEQIDYDLDMSEMVQKIKDNQPKHTNAGWLQIFPQAKAVFGPFIKLELKVKREVLKIRYQEIEEEVKGRLKGNPIGSAWMDDLIIESGLKQLNQIKKDISAVAYQLALIKTIGQKPEKIKSQEKSIKITEVMIEKAREFPLAQLGIEINRQGFTKCFGHNDKKPSAYCKKNFIHCFVCQKSWDTIAVLTERDGLTFRQAVLQLQ